MSNLQNTATKSDICEIPRWIRYKATLNNMVHEQFFETAGKDTNGMLLDVRTPEECENQLVEGAFNLNYLSHNLADQLDELDNSKSYYVFCRTGRRSLRVCMLMQNSGFKVVNLDGGLISQ